MKKLFALFVMSGAVLGALFFLTQDPTVGVSRAVSGLALTRGEVVKDGALVSIEYTLRDDKGEVIDSNVGQSPMNYVHGAGQMVPGLEKELEGLKVGAQTTVQIPPEEGYGPVDPQAYQEIPRDRIPPEAQQPGAMLMTEGPHGVPIPIRVHEVKEKTVVVDFNHPLAGKTLNFEVKVVDIQAPSAPR
jgi:FKBP-type peptidyl-prolyl cis-trans isomerase SlyD